MNNKSQFFETARERYQIKLNREAGLPRPWTRYRIFRQWRFCNVHREDDKTTRWFADNIRNPLSAEGDKLKIVRATVIFRWFNRIETGERIKDLIMGEWSGNEARQRLLKVSPVVTGAYIIKGPDGYTKLDGVLCCIHRALPLLPRMINTWGFSLQGAWKDLNRVYYLGRFMSYEIVSDLRWTPVLNEADDIKLWANAGPGCARGLGWVFHNKQNRYDYNSVADQKEMVELMQELLYLSTIPDHWPPEWKPWEMREVEHWLCEYDKFKRAERGEKLKRKYTPA